MKRLGCALALVALVPAAPVLRAEANRAVRQVAGSRADWEITPARLTAALLAETNRVRRAYGCRALRPLRALNAAADDQASYMALTRHASHRNALQGQANVVERVQRHGIQPGLVAENVASQPAAREGEPSPCTAMAADLVEAWMNSPGHRANLLNRNFTHLGCAARLAPGFGSGEYVFGAQVFSRFPASPDGRM